MPPTEDLAVAAEPSRVPAAILVVGANNQELARVVEQLRRRCGADYALIAERSATRGIERLKGLRDQGNDLAIILADWQLPDGSGIELLSQARSFSPDAKRALLLSWSEAHRADRAWASDCARAASLGELHGIVPKPDVEPDERFQLAIQELLDDWSRQHRPRFELIRIIGERWSEVSQAFRDHLERGSIPYGFYEPDSAGGRALLERAGTSGPLPIAILHDGRVFVQPTAIEIAEALGVNAGDEAIGTPDVAVVGAGPAGLAAAVYAASEGLQVLVIETEAVGGQAGTSSLIRNYLGFPNGLSGADLARRAYEQARSFGVKFLIARKAIALRSEGGIQTLTLEEVFGVEHQRPPGRPRRQSEVHSRAVVLAMGVLYRRIGIKSVDALVGRGVFYGAATTEAPAMRGEEVFVVGGANSAGQAAIFLGRFAAKVTLLIRGSSLSEGMSDYLVRELEALRNMRVRLNTELVEARGDQRLRSLVLKDRIAGSTEEVPAGAIFILIGAAPRTTWLPAEVQRDERGFVLTGSQVSVARHKADHSPFGTSLPGVFAVGDVRAGAVQRVASAVGEGSVAIRDVHAYLRRLH